MRELIRQRPQLVPDQPFLQRSHPSGIEQGFRQMLIHLAVPIGQKLQGPLSLPLGRAVWRGFPSEPKIRPNERQQSPRGIAHPIELCLDETVPRMDLTRLHQADPPVDPLRIPPSE